MEQETIGDGTVAQVLGDALEDGWRMVCVDGARAVIEHDDFNVGADVGRADALMRSAGYKQKYVMPTSGSVRVIYVERDEPRA